MILIFVYYYFSKWYLTTEWLNLMQTTSTLNISYNVVLSS
jgi:hypothetical protein